VNIREYSSMFVPVVDCISSVFRMDLSLFDIGMLALSMQSYVSRLVVFETASYVMRYDEILCNET
jgi:hypothetical protein